MLINFLNWRYAVKKYDKNKKVSKFDLDKIIESARLFPSSYGLQPVRLYVITNTLIKKEIYNFSYKQSIVLDCSHLILFTCWQNYNHTNIDDYFNLLCKIRNTNINDLQNYISIVKDKLLNMKEYDQLKNISAQAYICMSFALIQCALLGIDCTPMEGFENDKVDKLLKLEQLGLRSVLLMPIGYRHLDDVYSKLKKVRIDTATFVKYI